MSDKDKIKKYRVHELAKEFQTESKVVITILARNSIEVKNHMSVVGEETRALLEKTFSGKKNSAENKEKEKDVGVKAAVKMVPPSSGGQIMKRKTEESIVKEVPVVQVETTEKKPEVQAEQPKQETRRVLIPVSRFDNRVLRTEHVPIEPKGANANAPRPQQTYRSAGTGSGNFNNRSNTGTGSSQGQGQQYGQQRPPYQGNRDQGTQSQNRTAWQPRPAQGAGTSGSTSTYRNRDGQSSSSAGQYQKKEYSSQRPAGRYDGNRQGENRSSNLNKKIDQAMQVGNETQTAIASKSGFEQQRYRPAKKNNYGQDKNEHRYKDGKDALKKLQGQRRDGREKQKVSRINAMAQANAAVAPKEAPKPTLVRLLGDITVKDFAKKIGRDVGEVIKKLMLLGVMATINKEIDLDTAILIGAEFGVKVEELPPEADPTEIEDIEDDLASLLPRSPVVTVMGHVDHGKTSLLDTIRKTNVMGQEAGGITQHIGAYQVVCHGKKIVFLDTPGHEAFTAMRARGAQVTDVAILVVAADDGIMPQTIEAINHAKAAKVPIIVAINKIDKDGAEVDKIKQSLTEYGLVSEDWGGDTVMVPVSAKKNIGIDTLLEMILLVAEMQDLKANPERRAQGTVVEAELDKGRGVVATILVQKGTLYIGDTVIAGTSFGKVRAMINDRGEKVKKAGPSTPVEVLGLSDVPLAGDVMMVVDERTARLVAEKRQDKRRSEDLRKNQKVSLDDLFQQIKDGQIKDLNIVIKADVQGSIEALRQALSALKNEEVRTNIVHYGVGAINESDVMLAAAANALIIGFNVRPDNNARKAAENENIDIRTYRVIYEAINDVEAAMKGMLAPTFSEVLMGKLEIRKIISTSKGVFAGCYVTEGKVTNVCSARIVRDGIMLQEDKISSLRRFKDDVKEVASGYECGLTLDKLRDFKEGDIIEAFVMEEVKVD